MTIAHNPPPSPGHAPSRRRPPRGPGFWAGLGFTLLVCAFMVVPVVMSALAGVTVNFFRGLSSGLTLDWVAEVWRLYADTIWRSIWLALASLGITAVIGVPAAYVLARNPGPIARAIEETVALPIAIPGLALALALILTWGGAGSFRTSSSFVLAGHVIYTLPFMLRSVIAVMVAIDMKTLEEGAASLGAGFTRRFLTVVVPNALPGVLAGGLMVVTLSIGEFNLTWMLHTPLTKTLPVGLADSYASMRLEIASAYTLVFFVMIVPLLVAMQVAGRRSKRTTS
ncbi:ABC transporter permease subunit [Tistrella bauzanensis]|uniref:ABC transporter permease n=1 Tax=Tistrella TaxID=171436 RepID=UPI0031FA98B6